MNQKDLPAYIVLNKAFTVEECQQILGLAAKAPVQEAGVFSANKDPNMRKGQVAWLPDTFESNLANKIKYLLSMVNQRKYQFKLTGFLEPLQFTCYTEGADHYDWHKDLGPGKHSIRKLSFSIQLSDPNNYTGCDLEFMFHKGMFYRNQGNMVIFPSYEVHRVTPLISGERYSLVGWASGPPFA